MPYLIGSSLRIGSSPVSRVYAGSSLAWAGWTPADLGASVVCWLSASDATSFTLVDNAVSEWRDKSGNLAHVSQNASLARPLRSQGLLSNRPGVAFGAGQWLRNSAAFGLSEYAMFVVWRPVVPQSNGFNLALTILNGGSALGRRPTNKAFDASYSFNLAADNTSPSAAHLLSSSATGGTQAVFVNGARVALRGDAASGRAFTCVHLNGWQGTDGINYGSGEAQYFEVVICNAPLSESSRQKMEGYLAHNWGLAGSLPQEHVYKLVPPAA